MVEGEVIQINYWVEIHKEINKTIARFHGLVLLIHNSVEFSEIVDFLNKVRRDEKLTILYISLVNSYNHIKKTLETKPLDSKQLFMVDCVSGYLTELQDTIDCFYRKPPYNLEEMKELILENSRKVNPNIIMVDSLSQFINFSLPRDDELHELYKFLKSIKSDAIGIISDTVILLYNDKIGSMKKLPILFTDFILKIEVIKEKPNWAD